MGFCFFLICLHLVMRGIVDFVFIENGYLDVGNQSFAYLDDPQVQDARNVFVSFCIGYIPVILLCSILVFWGVVLYPGFHSTNDYLLMSMSVADFLMGVFCLPMSILSNLRSTQGMILSNKYACLAWFSSIILAGAGSLHTLLLIALDRYIAIMFPLRYHDIVTFKRATRTILLTWLYVVIMAFIPMLGWHTYMPEVSVLTARCNFYTALPFTYVVWSSITTVSVTVGVSAILYVQIIGVALRQVHQFRKQMMMLSPYQICKFESRVRSVKVTSFLMLVHMLLWLPYLLFAPLKYYDVVSPKNMEIIQLAVQTVNFANSLVNLPVYSMGRQEYQAVFKLMLTTSPLRWKSALRNLYRTVNSGMYSKETALTSERHTVHFETDPHSRSTLSDNVDYQTELDLFRFSFDRSTSVDSSWKRSSQITESDYISKKFAESEELQKQSLYSAASKGVQPEGSSVMLGDLTNDYLLIKLFMDRELALNQSVEDTDEDNDYIKFYQHITNVGSSVDESIPFYELLKQSMATVESVNANTGVNAAQGNRTTYLKKISDRSEMNRKSLFSDMFEKQKKEIELQNSGKSQRLFLNNMKGKDRPPFVDRQGTNQGVDHTKAAYNNVETTGLPNGAEKSSSSKESAGSSIESSKDH
ncbi:beta-2 adrenergic receptor-like isoform X1 [Biomphalaria glabrata]|uniref:Beta-2 adrenergic receptor-like isoform X1 n=1 Tax=Biomphalaria glabrata TaxID=6526 RepID=A0A9U8ELD7_BIOGL|nr:beta-2 adrenergic receptor-like isoform X1 [Biomphalaria glabrata]